MKKTLMLTALIASVNVYAGSIDYLAQQDAEYFAHASMTGKIGTSGAFYNPAGTAFMEDGLYVKVNTQTVFKDYTMNTDKGILSDGQSGVHNSDYPSVMVPSIQIVKKDGDRSYFLHGGIAAGGGSLKYDNGISAFEFIGNKIEQGLPLFGISNGEVGYLGGSKVKGSSFYYNLNLGMAQKVNEKFSVAGGVRFIYATRALEGTGHFQIKGEKNSTQVQIPIDVSIDSEREAYGIGWLVGFNYKPIEKLNIGFKYESEIKLDFEAKNGQSGLTTSSKIQGIDQIIGGIDSSLRNEAVIREWLVDGYRNLPAMMSLGISYDVNDRLTLLTSGNYYFIEDANDSNAYAHYTNGYEASVGFDYKLNEQYTLMAGYQYTNTGANEDTYKDTDYALDAHMYSIGLKYTPNETRTYTIAYSYVDYIDGTSKEHGTRFEKQVHAIGLAAEFKL
ncbi:MAG: outer membrane protein transport protein [Fusobacterium perfoetens]|uniref:OmpP1/FadL family transporter n=1 Tax=Fusobacterium perfoetens TaxID=852 RepID=UPI0023F4D517|nr:outer membrane protein transport protein [Fusobacterium perfoetens]MCI6152547.1 outer membrane protein transport protein [Fusobacterium perfoetens]MDY3237555.1 outer membrane protein transport protein [Fusobacterium perfoetens]